MFFLFFIFVIFFYQGVENWPQNIHVKTERIKRTSGKFNCKFKSLSISLFLTPCCFTLLNLFFSIYLGISYFFHCCYFCSFVILLLKRYLYIYLYNKIRSTVSSWIMGASCGLLVGMGNNIKKIIFGNFADGNYRNFVEILLFSRPLVLIAVALTKYKP